MLQCPACDTSLDQDFGMVTCKNCKAVLIIEISGDVRMGTNSENDNLDGPNEITANSTHYQDHPTKEEPGLAIGTAREPPTPYEDEDLGEESSQWGGIGQYMENPSTPEASDNDEEDREDNEFGKQDDSENHSSLTKDPDPLLQENFFESQTPEEESFDETINSSLENHEDVITTETRKQESFREQDVEDSMNSEVVDSGEFSATSKPNSNPVDITEFANSEQSNMDEGEYLYDLTIDRLDSRDLREALKDILMDKKLKINDHEFLKKIKNGCVCIPNLNPVKAKIIVEQLQYYDLNIHWKQKRVVIEETPDEEEALVEDIDNQEE